MKFPHCAAAALLLLASLPTLQAQPLSYPETRKLAQTDVYHGVTVADPYRWLEDDNSADTKAWVTAQAAATERYLAALPQRAAVKKLVTGLLDHERMGVPSKRGGRYFWTRNDGLQQQNVLVWAQALNAPAQLLLDPNTLSADGTISLAGSVPSPDGALLAYGLSGAGSDWQRWRVRDVTTGRDLPEVLEWVKFSRPAWTPDGKGFFYSRYDAPAPGAALTGVNSFQKLYYHRVGTEQAADLLVAENPKDKQWGFGAEVSDDGQWAVIGVWRGSARQNGLMLLALDKGAYTGAKPLPLTLDFDALYDFVAVDGDRLLLRTTQAAPRGRIVAVDLKNPQARPWKTVVPEGPDAITNASGVGARLVLLVLRDASSLVRVHAADGSLQREVALPGVGSASGFAGHWNDPETFFSFTSLVTPADIYRLDVASGQATLHRRPKTAFDPEQFETRRAFVTSRDGTRLPIFIAHRKGLVPDGSNATLLYGYGGFNVSQTPRWGTTAASWLKMGGVFVLAATRGGGEYGTAWHEAGTQLRKQNVFDDFIAAAEWLVAQKITRPEKLAINGGSNGGLLVGAVLNQRPELFGAAVPEVGVMDMLRFHKFTIGWAWVSDYGSSDDPAQFKALLAYSPLHTLRSGTRYPAVLVTTADHDDRVVPAHSFKYAAALQAADTGPAPKLIRIETRAGHGAGTATSKLIEARSDVLAFIANALKLELR